MKNRKGLFIFSTILIIFLFAFLLLKDPQFLQTSSNEYKQVELINTIKNNDEIGLSTLLDKRVNINFVSEEGLTPLETALNYQAFNCAIILMEHDALFVNDSMPLIVKTVMILNSYVQYQGSENYEEEISSILQLLKKINEKKPNEINKTDEDGNTALHYAASRGIPEVVELLLDLGADPNIQNDIGLSPLMQGVESGQIEATAILIQSKPKKDLLDQEGNTLLISAAKNGNVQLITTLFKYDKEQIDSVNKEGKTALMYAAEYGYGDAVKVLIEYGANKFLQSSEGKTALQYATEWEHQDIVHLLQ